jgi:hypothetical protein
MLAGAQRPASLAIVAWLLCATCLTAQDAATGQWIPLFNGRDLAGWQVKIRGYDLNQNFGETFRVEDGVLKVSYDQYDRFDGRFGHLFYRQPYSHYLLRAEYRFVGQQQEGGPDWAVRNSGLMLHSQPPDTMGKDQEFPVSIEVQLLGGNGSQSRPTANVCTPGTHVVIDGRLVRRHCTNSRSQTYHGDQWVTVEVEVRGNTLIRHRINGEVVLEYSQPQLDDSDADARPLIRDGQKMLDRGYIALQSESHPVEFRKVELMPLAN